MKFEKGMVVELNGTEQEIKDFRFAIVLAQFVHGGIKPNIDQIKNGIVGVIEDTEKDTIIVNFGENFEGYDVCDEDGVLDLDSENEGHYMVVPKELLKVVSIENNDAKDNTIKGDDTELIVSTSITKQGNELVLSVFTKDDTYEQRIEYDEEKANKLINEVSELIKVFGLIDEINKHYNEDEQIDCCELNIEDLLGLSKYL